MKRTTGILSLTACALSVLGLTQAAAESASHSIIAPEEVKWTPAPAALPPGAEVAVLFGDPAKEGLFAMRLKFPKGYKIPPHTHPKPEVVTIISGAFRLGMGETADPSMAKALTAGGMFALSPEMAHFAIADEDTVVQLNSTGPWSIKYVNPADDPRKASN